MAGLRCLIDSMIFDAIADAPGLLERVDRLTSAGRLELLAADASVREVAATPEPARRRRLRRVRVLIVPGPDEADPAAVARLRALRAAPGVDRQDALIAATAAAAGVPLVTEDRDLRAAAAVHLPRLVLWSWAGDLAPRIAALDEG